MRVTFIRDTEPSYLAMNRTLTLSGEKGRFEVALHLESPKGERIALRHELRREDVVRLTEGLTAWLVSPDSFPECKEPGCGAACVEGSDYCPNHQG
jgi:hypothetical protein